MDLPIYINFQETGRRDGGGDYREGDIEERVFEGIILAKCHLQLLCVAALLNQEKLHHIRGFFPTEIFRGFSLERGSKTAIGMGGGASLRPVLRVSMSLN